MKIKYIQHEVMNDAPFIGSLIVANDCSRNCKGCFNQELRDIPSIEMDIFDILKEVKSNPLNEGVILGGLEWSEQPFDMCLLAVACMMEKIPVIIYTSKVEGDFLKIKYIQQIFDYSIKSNCDLYVKYGCYDESNLCENNIQFGVKLATSNQYIKFYGGD